MSRALLGMGSLFGNVVDKVASRFTNKNESFSSRTAPCYDPNGCSEFNSMNGMMDSAFGTRPCYDPNGCPENFGAVGDEPTAAGTEAARRQAEEAENARIRAEAQSDAEKQRELEAAYNKAAQEAEKIRWNAGTWDRVKRGPIQVLTGDRNTGYRGRATRNTWSGQAESDMTASEGPVTYQQAIMAQPMPVLSPLRGVNQAQGVGAIVDAIAGSTPNSYNPALGTPELAIPSNATSGSMDASVGVNIVGGTAPGSAATTSSSFMSLFG